MSSFWFMVFGLWFLQQNAAYWYETFCCKIYNRSLYLLYAGCSS